MATSAPRDYIGAWLAIFFVGCIFFAAICGGMLFLMDLQESCSR